MRPTLLEYVQTILSSMNSDEVNSINDTPEATQVAIAVRTAYQDIVGPANLTGDFDLFQLNTGSGATAMTIPSDIEKIEWIKYNRNTGDVTEPNFQLLIALPLDEFLERMHRLDTTADNVSSYVISTHNNTDLHTIYYMTDRPPQVYATYDNNTILFDSLESALDSSLRKTKFQCYGRKSFTFTMSDSFVPPLNDEQSALLLQEAKSLSWLELRQQTHPKAEKSARRHWTRLSKDKSQLNLSDFDQLPNFGRK